jgi:hypothetical protein
VNARPHFASVAVFTHCHRHGLPVMLKGGTSCGKTRLVERMAWRLGRPLDKTGEEIPAAPGFQLVVSFNPATSAR